MNKQAEIIYFQDQMWEFWTPDGNEEPWCIRCAAPAVTLHEIEPRSTYPMWYRDSFNSVPICAKCHEWAGASGEAGKIELCQLRTERLQARASWRESDVVRELYTEPA